MKATIALVQGDAAGIGAELLVKLLDDDRAQAVAAINPVHGVSSRAGRLTMTCINAHSSGTPSGHQVRARFGSRPNRRNFMGCGESHV